MEKPLLRGKIHAILVPAVVVFGAGLLGTPAVTGLRVAQLLYVLSALWLYGFSAIYHIGFWKPELRARLRRIDHANIFIYIAASTSVISIALFPPSQSEIMLVIVWILAGSGAAMRVLWPSAPRWLAVSLYSLLGWGLFAIVADFVRYGGWTVTLLLIGSGALYSLGSVIYARKQPRLFPRVFGYHEAFHALTAIALLMQFAAIWIACHKHANDHFLDAWNAACLLMPIL